MVLAVIGFAFIGFKNNRYNDSRPIGAFRAIVCNKANTGFSDELMDEISMRFSINNALHKGNKFKYWRYEWNANKETKKAGASKNKATKATASSTPNPVTSTSKLDKAKLTCTELGFTLGTEKHGECVLKMMDN